jgi:hypothetical protein
MDDQLADDASGTICGIENTWRVTSSGNYEGPTHVEISCDG